MNWTTTAPAVTRAFLSSLVEAVEALTIVLAVASVRGWRLGGIGAFAGLALLVLIVFALGPLLDRIPLHLLQLVMGVLLLLFGMRWLLWRVERWGWEHEFDDTFQTTNMAFADAPAGANFTVIGTDLGEDSVVVDAGGSYLLGYSSDISVRYIGDGTLYLQIWCYRSRGA